MSGFAFPTLAPLYPMRSSRGLVMAAQLTGLLYPAAARPVALPPQRLDPEQPKLTVKDRPELELYHAEEQLLAARTTGSRLKAERKINSIKRRLRANPSPRG